MPSRRSPCPPERPLVWYVAYGSNLAERRFSCYLRGGRPSGASRTYPGCRDVRPPRRTLALDVEGGLLFAGRSRAWGGGMAFYDRAAPGRVACRAYLVSVEQFADVTAQEMRRPVGGAFAGVLADRLAVTETVQVMGPGHYETVTRLGVRDGAPLLTVTVEAAQRPALAAPAAAYLRWIATGLTEAHGWTPGQVATYLVSAPGAEGAWTQDEVAALAALGPP